MFALRNVKMTKEISTLHITKLDIKLKRVALMTKNMKFTAHFDFSSSLINHYYATFDSLKKTNGKSFHPLHY